MKTKIVVLVCITSIVAFQFLNSCRHEILYDHCKLDPIHVTLSATPATVNKSNGTISAASTGGSGYAYSLNEGAFQDTGYFSGLAAADYTVVVRNSWGCMDTGHITVGSLDPCEGVIVTVAAIKKDAVSGQSNGSISASATGGSGFTYSINNGAFQSSGSFSGLAAGNYTVTAKNSNGCMGTTQVTIGATNPCAGITVAVTTTKVDPVSGQSNGSITATATGGSGFSYSINNGAFQSSGTFTGLATGSYTITAKNSNGCTGVTTVNLGSTNPCSGITVAVTLTKIDPVSGQSNGSITATASGGSGFTYSLNNGAYQTSKTFSALAAGTYTVTAKNSNGCLGSAQITLTGTNPCASTNIIITNSTATYTPCITPKSGKITITATGSSGFSYNINNGAYQAGNVFSSLSAGSYTVGVKDLNGCTGTATAIVGTTPPGSLFGQVKSIITTRCSGSGCHTNGDNSAGYNFDSDCNIISSWDKINSSAVTGSSMPKSPQAKLSTAEKKSITDWINGGHSYSN